MGTLLGREELCQVLKLSLYSFWLCCPFTRVYVEINIYLEQNKDCGDASLLCFTMVPQSSLYLSSGMGVYILI